MSLPAEILKELQGEPRLAHALEQLSSLLVEGETISAFAAATRIRIDPSAGIGCGHHRPVDWHAPWPLWRIPPN